MPAFGLKAGLRAWAITLLLFSCFGCSSSLFTEDKKEELEQARGDGNFNKTCLGLDLSKPTMDIQAARALLSCLNSNGALQSYQDLVVSLSDAQLQILLDVLNAELLANPSRLKAADASFVQMDERGILQRALDKLSKVLDNGKLIRSAVRLLRQGTARGSETVGGEPRERRLSPDIIQSIKVLAQEVSRDAKGQYTARAARDAVGAAFEMGVRTTALKSYDAMVDGLSSMIPLRLSGTSLRFFTEKGLDYAKAKIRGRQPLAKILLWGLEDGSLLKGFDHYYRAECEGKKPFECGDSFLSVDHQTQALEALLTFLTLERKSDVLLPMTRLFRVMDAPISCMAGTKKIPNADMFVMNELIGMAPLDVPQWVMRTNTLKMKIANSMCSFPGHGDATFNDLMLVLRELARHQSFDAGGKFGALGRPLITVAHLLKGLQVGDNRRMSDAAKSDLASAMDYPENERYRRFLIHWLGDKDEEINLYTHLADLVGEVARPERAVVGNALYLLNAAAPGSKDRRDIESAARVLMTSRVQLRGRSLYDVLADSILKVDAGTVFDLLSGMSQLIDLEDKLVNPLLEVSRDALLVNDANPMLEIALALGLNADRHELLFETLFDIADTPQFEGAMRLTARMSANGTLRELIKGIFTMFRGNTGTIAAPTPADVPAVKLVDSANDRSTRGRSAWRPLSANWPQDGERVDACYGIDLDLKIGKPFPLDGLGSSAWEGQMNRLAACVNADGENAELERFLLYGVREKVGSKKTFLGFVTEQLADFIPTGGDEASLREIYDELGDFMTDSSSYGDLKAMSEALPFLFGKTYCSSQKADIPNPSCSVGSEKISVAQGLFRSLSVVSGEQAKLSDLLSFGRVAVEDKRMPKAASLLYEVGSEALERAADPVRHSVPFDSRPSLMSAPIGAYPRNTSVYDMTSVLVKKYEKREMTSAVWEEKTDEYFNQPLSTQERYYEDYSGRRRSGYRGADEFKASLKGLLDAMAKPLHFEALMTFFYRMHRSPYTPEWWAGWFRRLSGNVRPILYYYPGQYPPQAKPVVRLISQLEMLDLVVGNADFTLKEVGQPGFNLVSSTDNFGIKYLTLFSLCGEDISPALKQMERELQVFGDLYERTKGLPWNLQDAAMKGEVRRRVFNLNQVFPFLLELNRSVDLVGSDGVTVRANDLGVLRDLFKAVMKALPKEQHDPDKNEALYHRDKNPLVLIAEMVRLGLLKNLGSNMWSMNAKGQVFANHAAHVLDLLTDAAVERSPTVGSKLNPHAVALVSHLLRSDCDRTSKPEYASLPCVVPAGRNDPRSFNERYVLIGKLVDRFFEWMKDDDRRADRGEPKAIAFIKKAGYNASVLVDLIAGDDRAARAKFIRNVVKALKVVLATPKGTELLGDNVDLVEPLLTSSKSAHFTSLLLDARDSRTESFAAFREFVVRLTSKAVENDSAVGKSTVDLLHLLYKDPSSRLKSVMYALDWMFDDSDYVAFKRETGDRVMRQVMNWLQEEPSSGHARALRPRLQSYLGQRLADGNVLELIRFIGSQSSGKEDVFYKQIKFVGDPESVVKLKNFMDLLRRGLVDDHFK